MGSSVAALAICFLCVQVSLWGFGHATPTSSVLNSRKFADHKLVPGDADSFWLPSLASNSSSLPNNYQIFRNVQGYGAKGDGVTDDTDAINQAISDGNRCGQNCGSSTVTPAIVYFPPGTYIVSTPIIQFYYTQLIGSPLSMPTIKGSAGFTGMALIDSDPYDNTGNNWYINQDNFFRQVRNFVLDLTEVSSGGSGIHWQVAQATSLQNLVFNMKTTPNNTQQGIFMDNGSGGFMTDLVFNGGKYGVFLGNQQFTTRNLTFNNCQTAIYMNWNWAWTFKSITITNCGIGMDMSRTGANATQSVGSIILLDSIISNTPLGVSTVRTDDSVPLTGGTLVLDNVVFENVDNAVASPSGTTILAGGSMTVKSWMQGRAYDSGSSVGGITVQQTMSNAPVKDASLLDSSGNFFERSRPQYETLPASSFVSIKSLGAKGDGVTDDTQAIQSALTKYGSSSTVIFFDHGQYIVSSTVNVPAGSRITGEAWAMILASGSAFSSMANPQPVFRVGKPGDVGGAEISDMIFETMGPQPGAVLVEWNVRDKSGAMGTSGMWDVHFRVGGSAGTDLLSSECVKDPTSTEVNSKCIGSFLSLHIGKTASLYLENVWSWTADHDLDSSDHNMITIYNGRGIFCESQDGPVWMYGTASEHNQLYQYQLANTKNVFMGMIQTETPYYQPNPNVTVPFPINSTWTDPTFSNCESNVPSNTSTSCLKSWGLRVVDSSNVYVYGGGLYSFFQNYEPDCSETNTCQLNMVSVEGSTASSLSQVWFYSLTTKASTNMITYTLDSAVTEVTETPNIDTFCSTVALFTPW